MELFKITGIPVDATAEERALMKLGCHFGMIQYLKLGMIKYATRKEAERVNKRERRKKHRQSPVLTGRAYYENIDRRNSRSGRS